MDKVMISFDLVLRAELMIIKVKSIFIKTTDAERTRFTVVLCSLHTGEKCLPLIILNDKEHIIDRVSVDGVVMAGSKCGSMTNFLMEIWRQKVEMGKYRYFFSSKKRNE